MGRGSPIGYSVRRVNNLHTRTEPNNLDTRTEPNNLHTRTEPNNLHTRMEPNNLHTRMEPNNPVDLCLKAFFRRAFTDGCL